MPDMFDHSAKTWPLSRSLSRSSVWMDTTAQLWKIFADTQELVSHAKEGIPRCLTTAQRNAFFRSPEPPPWCIEMQKWPYHTPAWKRWLADTRAGKSPPLPATP